MAYLQDISIKKEAGVLSKSLAEFYHGSKKNAPTFDMPITPDYNERLRIYKDYIKKQQEFDSERAQDFRQLFSGRIAILCHELAERDLLSTKPISNYSVSSKDICTPPFDYYTPLYFHPEILAVMASSLPKINTLFSINMWTKLCISIFVSFLVLIVIQQTIQLVKYYIDNADNSP